jgi:uncharacterized protein YbjT (DUF2867 family)
MAAASDRVVTVFGGTGFLGRRIVRHLRLHGFSVRITSRHPERDHAQLRPDDPKLRSIKADVHDEEAVSDALADAYGVVNAVSLYVEQGWETYHSVHVESAQRVAALAQRVESNASSMFRESAPIPARNRSISENAVKANWRFGQLLAMPF